jgi:hypothetical protein
MDLAKARQRHHHYCMSNTTQQDWLVNEFARLVAERIGEPGQERFLALLRDELKKTVQEEVHLGAQRIEPRHAELLARMDRLEAAQQKLWQARKEFAQAPRPEPQAIATAEAEHLVYEAASPWRKLLMPTVFLLGLLVGALAAYAWFGKPSSAALPRASLPGIQSIAQVQSPAFAVPLPTAEADKLRLDFLKIKLEANAGRALGCSTTVGDCLKIYNIRVDQMELVGKSIESLTDINSRTALQALSIQALARAKLIPDMRVDGKPSARAEQQILDTGCSRRIDTQWSCLLDKSLGLR